MDGSNFLITGGTGFIGANLALSLNKIGNVTCLGRNNKNFSLLKSNKIKVKGVDLLNKKKLDKIHNNFDFIFHLAGIINIDHALDNPGEVFKNNTISTLNMLKFAQRNKSFFFFSSSEKVYGRSKKEIITEEDCFNPLEGYAESKLCSEFMVRNYCKTGKMNFIILRIANVFGPGQSSNLFIPSVIRQMVRKNKIRVGNLNNYRNFVYVKDLMSVINLALKKDCKNEIFNIASYNINLENIAKLLKDMAKEHLNKDVKIYQEKKLFRPEKKETGRFKLDCTKAKRMLSWKPKYSFEDALKETFEFSLKKNESPRPKGRGIKG